MRPVRARPVAFLLVLLFAAMPAAVPAQEADSTARWNSAATMELVNRGVELRELQLADTALRDYRANARGFLTFLAQLGDEFRLPPRVVKADQIAVDVYWRAPDESKQVVVGLRDTLLLPADIGYYRDRYGIVQNNFPDQIRLGDGNDIRGVPHPLSPVGRTIYDYARGDSVRIDFGGRRITLAAVHVRPRDQSFPAVVGTLYLDRETAQLARMELSFTRAAIRDDRIERLTVTLENGLVDGRFWLPRRQELEVARSARWLDFPARGIIRGKWEICCYEVNQSLPASRFEGPEIVTLPPEALREYDFGGELVDSIPEDVALATERDVREVQARAEELLQSRLVERGRGAAVSGRRISDFVRVNRVEGVALGAGTVVRLGGGTTVHGRARYGLEDARLKGGLSLRLGLAPAYEAFAEWDHRDLGDVSETSTVRNSIAAQEFGSDYTNPYEVRTAGVRVDLGYRLDARWRAELAYETHRQLQVNASPATGSYSGVTPVAESHGPSITIGMDRFFTELFPGVLYRLGGELRTGISAGGGSDRRGFVRLNAELEIDTRVAGRPLIGRTVASAVAGSRPDLQQYVFMGGPTTGPGYRHHELVGRAGVSQRLELRQALPFVAVPLGRYGRTPASMTLAPYVHATYVGGESAPGDRARGVYPSIGVGGLFFFDLVRVDVARGLRDGRWWVGVDLANHLWDVF